MDDSEEVTAYTGEQEYAINDGPPEPRKIGGWLYLVAFGVVLTPLKILFLLATIHLPLILNGTLVDLADRQSENYTPYLSELVIIEIIINLFLLVLSIYTIYAFFAKKQIFPLLYASYSVISLVFILFDSFAVSQMIPDISMFDPESLREMRYAAFRLLIWTPYVLLSVRCKETFIH